MLNQSKIQSIFVLGQNELEAYEALLKHDVYFSMIRPEFLNKPILEKLMLDIALTYYLEERPIYEPRLAMIFLLRHALMDEILTNPSFQRIRKNTEGDIAFAFIMAVMTLNLFIDLAQTELAAEDLQQVMQIVNLNEQSEEIFTIGFKQYNSYPKDLVQLETRFIQILRKYILKEQVSYNKKIRKLVRFADEYELSNRFLMEEVFVKPKE